MREKEEKEKEKGQTFEWTEEEAMMSVNMKETKTKGQIKHNKRKQQNKKLKTNIDLSHSIFELTTIKTIRKPTKCDTSTNTRST